MNKKMRCIKIFVIFSVRAFYFAVMSWCVWFNEIVAYAILFKANLKQSVRQILNITETFGEL